MFYDPSTTYGSVENDIPSVPMVNRNENLFNFNDTFIKDINTRWETCGYKDFYEQGNNHPLARLHIRVLTKSVALQYPPKGPLPTPPDANSYAPGCSIWNDIFNAALLVNPCWDVYQIATTCPVLWDVLGFPGSFDYLPAGAQIYFNRTDVQQAINAPQQDWEECTGGILQNDDSPPSGLSVLPRVIEKNTRTVIGHGLLDFILLEEGTLMMIQNLTWVQNEYRVTSLS
jgi:carboxypeptidase D